ncbi:DUF504 domain-containing protein [Sulfurisphaera ohwakuensis]|uniref:UPF0248 protein D1869_03380 n=1 Tax=Sulfurisphaera ohwakuensis TaxID=69656 RepID=A0A650CET1_SULOH|nr:RNA repair domain-containing protein [Sulfurisphaera ohwakuensis]MBB5254423.1 hypothetical protein [Sulfurisphaera ohwakuensis]QGR16350.1 DUF504 domain-containing protein [Sulfurisphaera ohwakuensis]
MRIKDAINKIFYTRKDVSEIYLIIRDRVKGTSEIPFSNIERVDNYYIYLNDDETIIPLHRVIEIREKDKILWKRRIYKFNSY